MLIGFLESSKKAAGATVEVTFKINDILNGKKETMKTYSHRNNIEKDPMYKNRKDMHG